MRVTITDIRAAGHCARGARTWFAQHGIDFRAFLRDGIDAAELLATGDGLACQVVERTIRGRWQDADTTAAAADPVALLALIKSLESAHG